jgi:hypothetical protein
VTQKEPPYRAALAYTAGPANIAAVQARAGKQIDAGDYRGAYALLQEMKALLKAATPVPALDAYSKDLEAKAIDYFNAADTARQTKTTLDQATADAQAAKKAYDDSVGKRLDTILKALADQKFVPAPAPAAAAGGGAPVAGGAPQPG